MVRKTITRRGNIRKTSVRSIPKRRLSIRKTVVRNKGSGKWKSVTSKRIVSWRGKKTSRKTTSSSRSSKYEYRKIGALGVSRKEYSNGWRETRSGDFMRRRVS